MKNDFIIDGEVTKIFSYHKDGSCSEILIDTCMLTKMNSFKGKWYVSASPKTKCLHPYAKWDSQKENKKFTVYMHRYLVDAPENLVVDHINGNTLDNRLSNLRVVSQLENTHNRTRLNRGNKSGIRGVSYHRRSRKWRVKVMINFKTIYVGAFNDFESARTAMNKTRTYIKEKLGL